MVYCESVRSSSPEEVKIVLVQVQISNLYIEKACKVGSYFFGNGTTYEDEVENREGYPPCGESKINQNQSNHLRQQTIRNQHKILFKTVFF